MAVTCGMNDSEFEKLKQILEAIPDISFICLDVANGYTQQFVDIVRKTRSAYPDHTIIVSKYFYFLKFSLYSILMTTIILILFLKFEIY